MTTAHLVGGLLALVMFCMLPTGQVWAQEGDELTPEQIVERIVVLRHELDLLLAALPVDLRREVDFTVDVGTKRGGRATLVIEAERLARGEQLELVTAAGEPLNGWQALSDRSRVRRADGTVVLFSCSE